MNPPCGTGNVVLFFDEASRDNVQVLSLCIALNCSKDVALETHIEIYSPDSHSLSLYMREEKRPLGEKKRHIDKPSTMKIAGNAKCM